MNHEPRTMPEYFGVFDLLMRSNGQLTDFCCFEASKLLKVICKAGMYVFNPLIVNVALIWEPVNLLVSI